GEFAALWRLSSKKMGPVFPPAPFQEYPLRRLVLLRRRNDAQRQFAQLRGRCRRRRVHQQVLRLLAHREERDFAQALRTDEQHDDTVDTEGAASMRRGSVLEGAVEAAEALLHIRLAEADLLERLDHQVRRLVTDRARSDLEAVADRVVLVGLQLQRVLAVERLDAALRH